MPSFGNVAVVTISGLCRNWWTNFTVAVIWAAAAALAAVSAGSHREYLRI